MNGDGCDAMRCDVMMLMMMRMRGLRENKTGAVLFASAVTGARVDGRAQVGRMRRAGNRRSSRGACGTVRCCADGMGW